MLRSLHVSATLRHKHLERLLRKYRAGRRSAADVVDALRALEAQNLFLACCEFAMQAVDAVRPVPTVVWSWVCANCDILTAGAARTVLRLAAADRRYDKHLYPHRHALASTPDGLSAMLHESGSNAACCQWVAATVRQTVDDLLSV